MGETKDALNKVIPVLNKSRRATDLMEAFPRVIRFELTGESNPLYLTIQQGRMALGEEGPEGPDMIVSGDAKEFAKVITAGVDVTHPIARGQLTVTKGKISEMTLLNRILWAEKGG